ncbi:hypothetical protein RFI_01524 [Reticulomyxa filosa]|uniref:Uncharacterized protein n=1 Tax=Reticulomyxa filosa TaxID=46433 RepID=X6PBV4_RETFI|nr:hypothetical protein RFI_01524 [Reticulomyxa filosa]|eukprot:ETO35539.1 hypothetical protein RFI_01524 [Reticulomyxa filosa]
MLLKLENRQLVSRQFRLTASYQIDLEEFIECMEFNTGVPHPQYYFYCISMIYQQSFINLFNVEMTWLLWTSIFTSNVNEMSDQLQSLDDVSIWSNKWKMLFAADKTQCITFRYQNKRKFQKMQLTLQHKPERIRSCKVSWITTIRPSLEYASAFWNGAADTIVNDTKDCNISNQTALELRQEEVKLYHKFIRWSGRLNGHNLVLEYKIWNELHIIDC